MNGTQNSNMTKIDTVLGEKAQSSVAVSATLSSTGWAGVDSPFTQTISVDGLTADQNGTISIAQTATIVQRDAARQALLSVTGQAAGTLTISADGELPEVDIPVVVLLLG